MKENHTVPFRLNLNAHEVQFHITVGRDKKKKLCAETVLTEVLFLEY